MTWTSRTSLTPSRPARPRRGARRVVWLVALLLAATLLAPPAAAGAAPRVVEGQVGYVFSDSITFRARVEDAEAVRDVLLFFGREGSRLVRRVYPEFRPGASLTLDYVERLEPGQYAPGTVFRYWWEFELADGSVHATVPQRFEYTDSRFTWQLVDGERVDLHYYGRGERRARELLEAAEGAIRRLEEEMGVGVQARVRVYAYNSARDMAGALSRRSEAYDDRVLTLGVAVSEDTLLLLGEHRDAEMVVAHELSHIVVGIATRNPFIGLPRWLDEGLAMHAEGELPVGNRRALEAAIAADSLISLRSMTSYSGQAGQVDLFYAQAHSVVGYLLDEHGRERMRELLAVFAEGVRQDDALQRAYGLGLDELEDRWRASLGLGPRPRGEALALTSGIG